MKVQCPCGAKYAIDVTPDMATRPFQLVCQNCQTDLTQSIQPLIAQALAELATPAATVTAASTTATAAPAAPTPPTSTRLRVSTHTSPNPAPSHTPAPTSIATTAQATPQGTEPPAPTFCPRHTDTPAVESCRVCKKPICPECMTSFGYVCSTYCAGQAEAKGIKLPVFADQRSVAIAREGRTFRYLLAASVGIAILLAALAAFYSFYLSQPHPIYEVALPKNATQPHAALPQNDISVLLQNGSISGYHLKSKKQLWQVHLIDTNAIQQQAKIETQRARKERAEQREELKRKPIRDLDGNLIRIPDSTDLSEEDEIARQREQLLERTAASMEWIQAGSTLWVKVQGRLLQIDPQTGRSVQDLNLGEWSDNLKRDGNQLVGLARVAPNTAKQVIIQLERGERLEKTFTVTPTPGQNPAPVTSSTPKRTPPTTPPPREVPSARGNTAGVGAIETLMRAIELKHNTELENAMADEGEIGPRKRHPELSDASRVEWVLSGDSAQKCIVKLIEFKGIVQRAIANAPAKSVLDGGEGLAGKFTEAANEILNDNKRLSGDDVRIDDRSRYQVTLRPAEGVNAAVWSGEIAGPPRFYSFKTINIIAGGETLIVLDHQNKKLWETKLAHPIADLFTVDFSSEFFPGSSEGAFLEQGETLYVADVGVLTAFDKSTGNARWRFPTVGTQSMRLDGKGALYVNTTSAGQDAVKFSQQVDVSRRTRDILIKLDAASGKVLWKAEAPGHLQYLNLPQNLLYTVDRGDATTTVPRLSIHRLHPDTGKLIWEFTKAGNVHDAAFSDRTIQLLTSQELMVLRYWSF